MHEKVYPALAKLRERAERLAADADATPRSPSDLRAAVERARIAQARYTTTWNAQQVIENCDRHLATPEREHAAFTDVREHLSGELERATEQLAVVRDAVSSHWDAMNIDQRALARQVEELTAMIRIIDDGGAIPQVLAQRLIRRGIDQPEFHVGMKALDARLAELRRQRAAAVAVLVRELNLETEPAPAG
jgi:hypothetical protein